MWIQWNCQSHFHPSLIACSGTLCCICCLLLRCKLVSAVDCWVPAHWMIQLVSSCWCYQGHYGQYNNTEVLDWCAASMGGLRLSWYWEICSSEVPGLYYRQYVHLPITYRIAHCYWSSLQLTQVMKEVTKLLYKFLGNCENDIRLRQDQDEFGTALRIEARTIIFSAWLTFSL